MNYITVVAEVLDAESALRGWALCGREAADAAAVPITDDTKPADEPVAAPAEEAVTAEEAPAPAAPVEEEDKARGRLLMACTAACVYAYSQQPMYALERPATP